MQQYGIKLDHAKLLDSRYVRTYLVAYLVITFTQTLLLLLTYANFECLPNAKSRMQHIWIMQIWDTQLNSIENNWKSHAQNLRYD